MDKGYEILLPEEEKDLDPRLILEDQLNSLLSKTSFIDDNRLRAKSILDYSQAGLQGPHYPDWLKHQVRISLDTPSSSWNRVVELTKKYQKLEAFLWNQERESRERELTAQHDLKCFKEDYKRKATSESYMHNLMMVERIKVKYMNKSIDDLLKEIKLLKDKLENNQRSYFALVNNHDQDVTEFKRANQDLHSSLIATDRAFVQAKKEAAMLRDQINQMKKDQEQVDNVVDFNQGKLLKPAIDGTTDGNWLWKLADGVSFLSKTKPDPRLGNVPILQTYTIETRHEENGVKAVKVIADLNEPAVFAWIDSVEYCKGYSLAGILYDPTKVTPEQ